MATRVRTTYLASAVICLPFLSVAINPFSLFRRSLVTPKDKRFQHEAQVLRERYISTILESPSDQTDSSVIDGSQTSLLVSSSTPGATRSTVITVVTPSPGAQPVTITSQGQVITSFAPYFSVCPLLPSDSGFSPLYGNSSSPPTSTDTWTPTLLSTWDTSECSTSYTPTITPICSTVLTGLASLATITNCSTSITFSSDVSFSLQPAATTNISGMVYTESPWVQAISTFFIAPWQELTNGATPSTIEALECSADSAGATTTCVDSLESWAVSSINVTVSSAYHFTIAQTVSGPSALLVETMRTDITGYRTYVSVNTTVIGSTPVTTETIVRVPITTSIPSTSSADGSAPTESLDDTSVVTSTSTNIIEVTFASGFSTLPPLSSGAGPSIETGQAEPDGAVSSGAFFGGDDGGSSPSTTSDDESAPTSAPLNAQSGPGLVDPTPIAPVSAATSSIVSADDSEETSTALVAEDASESASAVEMSSSETSTDTSTDTSTMAVPLFGTSSQSGGQTSSTDTDSSSTSSTSSTTSTPNSAMLSITESPAAAETTSSMGLASQISSSGSVDVDSGFSQFFGGDPSSSSPLA
jgi:hypothetical protein